MSFHLEVKNLSKTYRNQAFKAPNQVLCDISFSIKKGECLGLMGHNGAGKTTTIKAILGLIFPDVGQILFSQRALDSSHKRHIGYMPEVSKLALLLTVREIFEHQLQIFRPDYSQKARREVIVKELERLQLIPYANRKIAHLSKGLARRVAWGQSCIHDPDFLILDEPLSGLDPYNQEHLAQWIVKMRESGKTILFCSHELSMVERLSDHVVILNKGKVVYSQSTGDFVPLSLGQKTDFFHQAED